MTTGFTTWDIVSRLHRREGLRGFWRGALARMANAALWGTCMVRLSVLSLGALTFGGAVLVSTADVALSVATCARMVILVSSHKPSSVCLPVCAHTRLQMPAAGGAVHCFGLLLSFGVAVRPVLERSASSWG